jgi:hypothetical protein
MSTSKKPTNLYFTRNSPLRTTIVDEQTHRPLFRLETPQRVRRRTTTIRRLALTEESDRLLSSTKDLEDEDSDSDSSTLWSKKDESESEQEPELEADETDVSAPVDEVARIHWHLFRADQVVFKGQMLKRSEILPRSGLYVHYPSLQILIFDESIRFSGYTFTVGGTNLKWTLGPLGLSSPKVRLHKPDHNSLNNRNQDNTIIAQFHHKNPLNREDKSYLEVSADGMEIIDHIILTFVLVEKQRREG